MTFREILNKQGEITVKRRLAALPYNGYVTPETYPSIDNCYKINNFTQDKNTTKFSPEIHSEVMAQSLNYKSINFLFMLSINSLTHLLNVLKRDIQRTKIEIQNAISVDAEKHVFEMLNTNLEKDLEILKELSDFLKLAENQQTKF